MRFPGSLKKILPQLIPQFIKLISCACYQEGGGTQYLSWYRVPSFVCGFFANIVFEDNNIHNISFYDYLLQIMLRNIHNVLHSSL